MGRYKAWLERRITRGAIAARDAGHDVYVHTLTNVSGNVRAGVIRRIEGVGWRLDDQRQYVGGGIHQGKPMWSLTFRRA
jgi:hypothetical protein